MKSPGRPRNKSRTAGVFLPVFSLPTRLDHGDFGPSADWFMNWLVQAGQTWWMTLPLLPTDSTGSPYASASAFAYNPMYISPERLRRRFRISDRTFELLKDGLPRRRSELIRWRILNEAWQDFQHSAKPSERESFDHYVQTAQAWLEPYAVFSALKRRFSGKAWWLWPETYRHGLDRIRSLDRRLQRSAEREKFLQWVADSQWQALRRSARRRGILILGDMPFVVRHDSADVWNQRELFRMHGTSPKVVAGMPPDYFSRFGQRWGTPVYNWPAHRRLKYDWWHRRFVHELRRFDAVRLDHFQGFTREWAIPARARDARHGVWQPAAGAELFGRLSSVIGPGRIVAEDLGLPLPANARLRERYGWPGLRLFEFGWSGLPGNLHALHHIQPGHVYMTSNHDLPSVREWWESQSRWYERERLKRLIGKSPPWIGAVELVYHTPAQIAIASISDVLGLGRSARINRPGTRRGNWRWHLTPKNLTRHAAQRLKSITVASGRGR